MIATTCFISISPVWTVVLADCRT